MDPFLWKGKPRDCSIWILNSRDSSLSSMVHLNRYIAQGISVHPCRHISLFVLVQFTENTKSEKSLYCLIASHRSTPSLSPCSSKSVKSSGQCVVVICFPLVKNPYECSRSGLITAIYILLVIGSTKGAAFIVEVDYCSEALFWVLYLLYVSQDLRPQFEKGKNCQPIFTNLVVLN